MVALATILGVPLGDVLYTASKNSSSTDWQEKYDEHLSHNAEPATVQKALLENRSSWLDTRLWNRVNEQLSYDMEAPVMQERLTRFRQLLSIVQERCSKTTTLKVDRKCYWKGNGCYYPCIDRIVEENTFLARL